MWSVISPTVGSESLVGLSTFSSKLHCMLALGNMLCDQLAGFYLGTGVGGVGVGMARGNCSLGRGSEAYSQENVSIPSILAHLFVSVYWQARAYSMPLF